MTDFNSLSSSLQGEVMVDIANGFFGARKEIDDERELFEHIENDIRLSEQRALNTCAQLQALLTCDECVKILLRMIGVPVSFLQRVEFTDPWLSMKLPFALTDEGRYKKCVLHTYEKMYNAFGFFLHGVPYKKMDSEEKWGRTTGYYRYMEWCDDLNERISVVNRDHSPTQVLNVVRGMDVEKVAKQRAVGAINAEIGCTPGEDMCLLLLPKEELEKLALPELPALDTKIGKGHTVAALVKKYASEVYRRERDAVQYVLEILKKNT
ncbi:MAG: hypothetical protein MI749_05930 [Desulfovibrionales bacterium]|nr:hypothetical protein [Desulfovibrionales bacterium]